MRTTVLLILTCVIIAGIMLLLPPVAQDLAYHAFVDDRELYGIPNFWNVVSNTILALVGLLGLLTSLNMTDEYQYRTLRREFGILFTAALMTAIGSAHYHLAPDNSSLVWDRLPMAVVFTTLVSIVISIYVSKGLGKTLLWPLIAAGVCSVLYWYRTEMTGDGDLRPYAIAQFLSILIVLVIVVMYRSSRRPGALLLSALLFYGIAKITEHYDDWFYQYSNMMVSGHTLKHVAAAIALFMIYLVLTRKAGGTADEPG